MFDRGIALKYRHEAAKLAPWCERLTGDAGSIPWCISREWGAELKAYLIWLGEGVNNSVSPSGLFIIADAILELNNKPIQSKLPVVNGHGPFFGRIHDGKVNKFSGWIVCREQLALADDLANDAVQGFDGIGGVNGFSNVLRRVKQGVQVRPVGTPATALSLVGIYCPQNKKKPPQWAVCVLYVCINH